jgi:hypothetical protein
VVVHERRSDDYDPAVLAASGATAARDDRLRGVFMTAALDARQPAHRLFALETTWPADGAPSSTTGAAW